MANKISRRWSRRVSTVRSGAKDAKSFRKLFPLGFDLICVHSKSIELFSILMPRGGERTNVQCL
jgi:ribosomal protein L32E